MNVANEPRHRLNETRHTRPSRADGRRAWRDFGYQEHADEQPSLRREEHQ